jgi:hypothetical protein
MLRYVLLFACSVHIFSCRSERVDVDVKRSWLEKSCAVDNDCVGGKVYDVCGINDCPDVSIHRDFEQEVNAARDAAAGIRPVKAVETRAARSA